MNFTKENLQLIADVISKVKLTTSPTEIRILEDVILFKAFSFGIVSWDLYFRNQFIMKIGDNQHDGSLNHRIEDAFWKVYRSLVGDRIRKNIFSFILNGKDVELTEYGMTSDSIPKVVDGAEIKQRFIYLRGEPILVVNHVADADRLSLELTDGLLKYLRNKALEGEINISLFNH